MGGPWKVTAERFLEKVVKTDDECWLWQGWINDQGYGECYINGKKRIHRVLFELLNGPIPVGQVLDHLCRVRHCVNPAHLEVVTHRINILRGVGATARNAVKTHCPRGHELVGTNIKWRKNGRECRTCDIDRKRRVYAVRAKKIQAQNKASLLRRRGEGG